MRKFPPFLLLLFSHSHTHFLWAYPHEAQLYLQPKKNIPFFLLRICSDMIFSLYNRKRKKIVRLIFSDVYLNIFWDLKISFNSYAQLSRQYLFAVCLTVPILPRKFPKNCPHDLCSKYPLFKVENFLKVKYRFEKYVHMYKLVVNTSSRTR